MDERRQLVTEYFKLYVLLNKANRQRNERTELDFELVEIENQWTFLAHLNKSSENAKIQLCIREHDKWEDSGCSGLNMLEGHLAKTLNKEYRILNINKKQPPSIKQTNRILQVVRSELRSLFF